ncbi:MAG: lysoplasmalogenase [Firmicutes bacterium]|nr:lysoplasmalogenase [Bacillota bacterium]
MVIALSAALAAASVTHLAACGLGKSRLRYFTKLLLMPLVAALYCALADRPAPAVLAAMFCGWVGDFFMIYKHKDAFLAAGMAAFGVGHILYVAHIGVIAAAAEPRLFTALAATLVPGAVAIVIFAVLRRRIPKQLRLPGLLYGLLLASLGSAAFIALRAGAPGGAYLLAGGCLFLCSDGILSFETFRDGDSNAADVAVMLTYIAAQTLLAIGFSMG